MRTIIINNPGPQGATGPQGVAGPSGSTQPFSNVSGSIWATTSSLEVSGSFIVSGSSTFTNIGPAIFSGSVDVTSGVTMSSAVVSGDVTVLGTASINVLQINTTINSTGSNTLGDSASDTQTLYGTVVVPTGSLNVTGSINTTQLSSGITQIARFGSSFQGNYVTVTVGDLYAGSIAGYQNAGTKRWELTNGGDLLLNHPSATPSVSGNGRLILSGPTAITMLGNVSIGTTTPSASLHIKGTTTSSLSSSLLIENSSSAYSFRIKDNGDLAATSNYITISSYDTTINGGNNVAINGAAFNPGYIYRNGTTSGFLSLANDGTVASSITLFGSTHATLPNLIRVTAPSGIQITGSLGVSSSIAINTSPSAFNLDTAISTAGGIRFNGALGGNLTYSYAEYIGAYYVAGWSSTGNIGLRSGASQRILISNTDQSVGITLFGNRLGLANATPSAKLHITGEGSGSATTALRIENSNASASMVVLDNGNVGIGTTSPASTLDVSGSTRVQGNVEFGLAGALDTNFTFNAGTRYSGQGKFSIIGTGATGIYVGVGSGANATSGDNFVLAKAFLNEFGNNCYGFVGLNNTLPMTFRFGALGSSIEAMRLTTSSVLLSPNTGSNVLVGTTTNIGSKFGVRGTGTTSATTALRVENTNASASMVVLDNGFVGINTGSAQYNLDVNGTARFVNDVFMNQGAWLTGHISAPNQNKGILLFNSVNGSLEINQNWSPGFGSATLGGINLYTNGSIQQRINSKGNILFGTTTDVASSKLTIESTTQGFLPPRMTTTQKNAIATPAAGLMVYDTDLSKVNFYNGSSWNNTGLGVAQVTPVTLASGSWSLVSSLYEYDYSNVLITSSSIVDIIPDNSTIAIVQAAQVLPSTVSTSGSVKLFATNLPTADIIVTVNIFN